ncbi:DUF6249 domain-containing protein [Dysgonomonas sp. ZJ279]|nr:DUF6249 domain-containing protein [Dysgonomonas sp. ZJ279]
MYLGLISIRARYRERMELIKQGIVPQNAPKPTPNKYRALRNGFLCIGVALGLIIGFVVTQCATYTEEAEALIIGSSVLFFLGIAYVLFYFATKNNKEIDSDIE